MNPPRPVSSPATHSPSRGKSAPGSKRSTVASRSTRSNHGKSNDALHKRLALENPSSDPGLYMSLIKEEKEIVLKNAQKDREKEMQWLKNLPYHEQLEVLKEEKVILRWRERLGGWEKIQTKLMKKVSAHFAKTEREHRLMMDSDRQSEFRAQNEKYGLLLAVMPAEERFSSTNWVMGLRGGGTANVSVGHLFSGLQCEILSQAAVPAIIRKPKILMKDFTAPVVGSYSNTVKTTDRGDSSAPKEVTKSFKQQAMDLANEGNLDILRKQKKLEKALKTIRPHDTTTEETDTLYVKSIDLFDWALQSNQDYFDGLRASAGESLVDGQHVVSIVSGGCSEEIDRASDSSVVKEVKIMPSIAKISFKSPREIVMEGLQNTLATYKFVFKNVGTVAIEYSWRPDPVESEFKAASKQTNVELQLFGRSVADRSREKLLVNTRPRFFCSKSDGRILPGETLATTFNFLSEGSSGSCSQSWRFNTVPNYVQTAFESTEDSPASFSSNLTQPTPIQVFLHGQAISLDEKENQRKITENVIRNRAVESICREAVEFCLRKVFFL